MTSNLPRNPFPIRNSRSHSYQPMPMNPTRNPADETIPKNVDSYLENTYHGLITKKIDSLCKAEMAPTNSLLINYIHFIYHKYSLIDPMVKYGDQRYFGTTKIEGTTQLRGHRQSEGLPQTSLYETRINPEGHHRQDQYTTPPRHPIDKSRRQSFSTELPYGSDQHGQTTSSRGVVESRAVNSFGPSNVSMDLPSSHPAVSRYSNTGTNMNAQNPEKEIQAIFRYCFCCEKSVLEYNMLVHQKNCPDFPSLYTKKNEEIVSMLETKIERMKNEMIQILNKKEEYRLDQLQNTVAQWIQQVEECQAAKTISNDYENGYNDIKKLYQSRQLMLLELSYKLRWFMRIRSQLKNHFGI